MPPKQLTNPTSASANNDGFDPDSFLKRLLELLGTLMFEVLRRLFRKWF